jgi:hypothetical protein
MVTRWFLSRDLTCLLISNSHFCTRWLQSLLAGSQDSQRGSLMRFHAMMVGSSLYLRLRTKHTSTGGQPQRKLVPRIQKGVWTCDSALYAQVYVSCCTEH